MSKPTPELRRLEGGAESADLLMEKRTTKNPLVMVMSYRSAYGYWGRGYSVRAALRNARWLETGDEVLVFTCNKKTEISSINGGVSGGIGEVYKGKVTRAMDVKVTHKLLPVLE